MKYLPDTNDLSRYYVIDIEADDLNPTKIWCMCVVNLATGYEQTFSGHAEIKRFFETTKGVYVGHNVLSYDGPAINKLIGPYLNLDNMVDTLVLSYMYDPSITGGHSLKAWGDRFKLPKGDHNDWSQLSPQMIEYCRQDVQITKRLFEAITRRLKALDCSEFSLWIEHHIRDVINEQENNGWYFDIPGAQALASTIRAEQDRLGREIEELFPPRLEDIETYEYRTLKNGEPTHHYKRHKTEYPELVHNGSQYTVRDYVPFNIGSPKQRVTRLLELGWEPTNFTAGGQPQTDEESLVRFSESSGLVQVKAIADWLVCQGRATMVEGWLNNVNHDTHCVHGQVFTCGANSRRMRHAKPNTANIPKAKAKVRWGKECRSLWQARPGRKQVGYDASRLELMMFAHHLADPEAIKLYSTGDPHLHNTRALELPDEYRDLTVKNALYCFMYGGQDLKLGKTTKPELDEQEAKRYGKWVRERLLANTPGLERLTREIQAEFDANGGVLKTIDGGFVRCPAKHAALNYKLQPDGAILMKLAAIKARDKARELGLDDLLVGSIHDEGQHDVAPGDAEVAGKMYVKCIEEASEQLNLKAQITGEYKIGNNWAETH